MLKLTAEAAEGSVACTGCTAGDGALPAPGPTWPGRVEHVHLDTADAALQLLLCPLAGP